MDSTLFLQILSIITDKWEDVAYIYRQTLYWPLDSTYVFITVFISYVSNILNYAYSRNNSNFDYKTFVYSSYIVLIYSLI
jgi:hypothetical protein